MNDLRETKFSTFNLMTETSSKNFPVFGSLAYKNTSKLLKLFHVFSYVVWNIIKNGKNFMKIKIEKYGYGGIVFIDIVSVMNLKERNYIKTKKWKI